MKPVLMLLAVTVMVSAAGIAHAAGGLYVDDIKLTNNGRSVLSADFEDNKLTDWAPAMNATIVSSGSHPVQHALYLSSHEVDAQTHAHSPGMVRRALSIDKPGVIELSMTIYISPGENQSNWYASNARGQLQINLSPESVDGQRTKPVVTAGLILQPRTNTCGQRISNLDNQTGAIGRRDDVMAGKWVRLFIGMNPTTKLMTFRADDLEAVTLPYDPANVKTIKYLTISSTFSN